MHYTERVLRVTARKRAIAFLAQYGWAIFAVLFVLGVLSILAGCCAVAIQDSVTSLREEFNTYRAAVVPHPSYSPEEAERVNMLGKKVDRHIEALERVAKGEER